MDACREQHPELKIQYCNSALEAVTDADAMVLVTEWSEFQTASLSEMALRMARAVLVDGRNIYDPETAKQAGFDYTGIGRRQKITKKAAPAEPATVA
jgi:UDPglucose 6-dehydrogenase